MIGKLEKSFQEDRTVTNKKTVGSMNSEGCGLFPMMCPFISRVHDYNEMHRALIHATLFSVKKIQTTKSAYTDY